MYRINTKAIIFIDIVNKVESTRTDSFQNEEYDAILEECIIKRKTNTKKLQLLSILTQRDILFLNFIPTAATNALLFT